MERPVVFILFMIDAKGVVRERGTRGKDLDQTVERLVEEAMPKK
jgi:acid phosphatase family membrane protein YuiD